MAHENRTISDHELAYTNMIQIEALVALFVKKGLLTEIEIMDEIKKINHDLQKKNQSK